MKSYTPSRSTTLFISCLACGDELWVKSEWTGLVGRQMGTEKPHGSVYKGMDTDGIRGKQPRPKLFFKIWIAGDHNSNLN